jgi:hypothetical protein
LISVHEFSSPWKIAMQIRKQLLALLCVLIAFVPAAQADSIIVHWNEIAVRAVRNGTLGPPMVARALAMVHTATYDAWAAYDPVALGTRYGGALRQVPSLRTVANKEKAVSYAAYRVLMDLYPAQAYLFTGSMMALGYDPNDTSTDSTTPQGIGNLVAQNLLGLRHGDGSNQKGDMQNATGVVITTPYGDYTGYQPVNTTNQINDPNRWQPLHFSNGVAPRWLGPHWANVTPFALTNGGQFRAPPPHRYVEGNRAASRRYVAQARQIVNLTARLTDKQKVIAEYWADGPRSETPPGHWNVFAQIVSLRDGHTVDEDAKMFFALNNALMDAGIAAWDTKIYYDNQRPITAIHFLFAGVEIPTWRSTNGERRTVLGENWLPFQPGTFISPPFADYVSGHSTYSAASAEVLRSFTGSDTFGGKVIVPAYSSRAEPGMWPREAVMLYWPTFSSAADQAGLSRRLGGIHFLQADMEGRKMGRKVGALAWEKAQTYFNGTAAPAVPTD